jgi:hypothetical protein
VKKPRPRSDRWMTAQMMLRLPYVFKAFDGRSHDGDAANEDAVLAVFDLAKLVLLEAERRGLPDPYRAMSRTLVEMLITELHLEDYFCAKDPR